MTFPPYRFQVGIFHCRIVPHGSFAYPTPAQVLFIGAPHNPLHLERPERTSAMDLLPEQ